MSVPPEGRLMEKCPHCGASLPVVKDAFCSFCHAPLESEATLEGPAGEPSPALPGFTRTARVVIVLCVLASAGGTAAYIDWAWDGLPTGSYPLWFFAIPVFALGAGLAVAVLAVLRACGVRIFRDR